MWERFISMSSRNPITLLASLATWLPIILAIYRRKKLTAELKILLFYLLIYAVFDISEWITAIAKKNNLYLHNINEWIGILITGLLYAKILANSSLKKKVIIILTLVAVTNSIFKFSWEEIAGYSFTFNKVVIITFVFLHFHSILTEVKVSNIIQHPPFWISAAFLISACGMLFIYLFWHYTLASSTQMEMFRLYNSIGHAFIFIFMILLSCAFWTSKFTKQDVQ